MRSLPISYDTGDYFNQYLGGGGSKGNNTASSVSSGSSSLVILYVILAILILIAVVAGVLLLLRFVRHLRRKREANLRLAAEQRANPAYLNAAVLPSGESETAGNGPAEIPGETIPMLSNRICAYLKLCGVEVGSGDMNMILARYASAGTVRIAGAPGTQPQAIYRLIELLNAFFGLSANDLTSGFVPAYQTDKEFDRTEVLIGLTNTSIGQPFHGIGDDTFRGILREAEDEYFIEEREWRLADELLRRCGVNPIPGERNRLYRRMESFSSCLLATGEEPESAFDKAVYYTLFPYILTARGGGAIPELYLAFAELFEHRAMTRCRGYFRAYGLGQ